MGHKLCEVYYANVIVRHEVYKIILDGELHEAPINENPQVSPSPRAISNSHSNHLPEGSRLGMWNWNMGNVSVPKDVEVASLTICSEFADANPSADVIGVDLSPIQPKFVPPNCRFEVDDITQEWTYPDNHFDFIHVRAMIGSIPDWTGLYKKAYT